MTILDFKEIPEAHRNSGLQDTFEMFARDFLEFMGYKIIVGPDRGADGGRDLLVQEKRSGVGGETTIKWLVSCKHKAHSGNSVSPSDEKNIYDRVISNNCNGFIGCYSTLASSGLNSLLCGMKDKFEIQIFDKEKIEGNLLHSSRGLEIADRYFHNSLAKWRKEDPSPAEIFHEKPSLRCKVCQKELLDEDDNGVITIWQKREEQENKPLHIEYIFWTCRGNCDAVLARYIRSKNQNVYDGWEDISDVMMPIIFIKWIMTIMNEQKSGVTYSDEAFKNLKEFLLVIFPYISKHPTKKQVERARELSTIPSYLGGLGYED